jgi:hypothetical protein
MATVMKALAITLLASGQEQPRVRCRYSPSTIRLLVWFY